MILSFGLIITTNIKREKGLIQIRSTVDHFYLRNIATIHVLNFKLVRDIYEPTEFLAKIGPTQSIAT